MKKHRFNCLKGEMKKKDIDNKLLGEILGVDESAISRRLSGAVPWKLDEALKVAEELNWPLNRFCELFPPKGMTIVHCEQEEEKEDITKCLAEVFENAAKMIRSVS